MGKSRTSVRHLHPLLLLLVVMLSVGVACTRANPNLEASPNTDSRSDIPHEIRLELVQMGRADQEVRQLFTAGSYQDTLAIQRMVRTDSARTMRLREIVGRYGWPDVHRAGADAAQAAFLILQHSPAHDFQKEMLPIIEASGLRGDLPLAEIALLTDRVLMHEGLPQRYGSQVAIEGGRLVLHPIEDELNVDTRRSAMGLPPLEEYLTLLEAVYGMPVTAQP